jgi:hypothetical protein
VNVRLQIKSNFICLAHYQNKMFTNQYHVTVDLTTACTDNESQNVAMDRIMYFLHEVLQDSVLINCDDSAQIRLYRAAGMRVTTLPEAPVDQIIGMMLYCKLNAICESRVMINAVGLCSDHGNHVWYLHDDSESLGPFAEAGWWNRSTPLHWHTKGSGSRVVDLKTCAEWNQVDLDWPNDDAPAVDGKVVFARFDRDDKK